MGKPQRLLSGQWSIWGLRWKAEALMLWLAQRLHQELLRTMGFDSPKEKWECLPFFSSPIRTWRCLRRKPGLYWTSLAMEEVWLGNRFKLIPEEVAIRNNRREENVTKTLFRWKANDRWAQHKRRLMGKAFVARKLKVRPNGEELALWDIALLKVRAISNPRLEEFPAHAGGLYYSTFKSFARTMEWIAKGVAGLVIIAIRGWGRIYFLVLTSVLSELHQLTNKSLWNLRIN